MDNASKALLMAGGVMISIAIISVAVYFYTSLQGYASSNQDVLSSTQIHSFNRFYTAYKNSTNTIRVVDALNILNRAIEDEVTTITLDYDEIHEEVDDDEKIISYTVSTSEIYLNDDVLYEFGYNPEGKVDSISITKK